MEESVEEITETIIKSLVKKWVEKEAVCNCPSIVSLDGTLETINTQDKADIARILSSDEVLEENNKQDVLALATALLADEDLFFNSYNRSLELHKHIFHEIVQVGYVKSFSYNIHFLIQILTGLRTTAYLKTCGRLHT